VLRQRLPPPAHNREIGERERDRDREGENELKKDRDKGMYIERKVNRKGEKIEKQKGRLRKCMGD
jgi:hypothetical protein